MAKRYTAASSQYSYTSFNRVFSYPLTIGGYIKYDGVTPNNTLISVGSLTGAARFQVDIGGGLAQTFRVKPDGVSDQTALNLSTLAGNYYVYATCTEGPDGSLQVWANGVASTSQAFTNGGTPTMSRIIVGTRLNSGVGGRYANGDLAELGVWNTVLSQDEIISLSKGFSPRLIRPSNLVGYIPLINNNIELIGGDMLIDSGSPVITEHPIRIG